MNKQYHLLEEVDSYIRKEYKNDLKKMNGLICLLKTNYNNIETLKNPNDFKVVYKQAEGCEKELLEIINICKNSAQK